MLSRIKSWFIDDDSVEDEPTEEMRTEYEGMFK